MKEIDNIKEKIGQIEEILCNIRKELNQLSIKNEKTVKAEKAVTKQIVPIPNDEDLKSEFENLYSEFIKSNTKKIEDFIKNKDKVYLRAFCKANSLPIDTSKNSKERIADEVMKWMSQRKVITK